MTARMKVEDQIDANVLQELYNGFTQRYAVTSPAPVSPDDMKPPDRKPLRYNWRAWAFGPVSMAGAIVSALRTAAAAVGVAAIDRLVPGIPPQLEALPVVVAVELTIVIGMIVWTYSRLQTYTVEKLAEEMAEMKFLKIAIVLAVTIALVANVTQVAREQYSSIDPTISFVFDLASALLFSVGMVALAVVGADQLAYLLAHTDLEHRQALVVWEGEVELARETYDGDEAAYNEKRLRSWNRSKRPIITKYLSDQAGVQLGQSDVQKDVQAPVQVSSLDDMPKSRMEKKQLVLKLLTEAYTGDSVGVIFADVKDKARRIPRATFSLYANELVGEGLLSKGRNNRGWKPNGDAERAREAF